MTCALNGVESTLGTQTSLGFRTTLESLDPDSRQTGLTERTCRSPTRLTNASANTRGVFNKSTLRLEDCNVQTGALLGPLVQLVSPKVELYEDAGIHSPGAS